MVYAIRLECSYLPALYMIKLARDMKHKEPYIIKNTKNIKKLEVK
jgi:hypothetical protein